VEKADLAVQKIDLSIAKAQNELYETYNLVPGYEVLVEPDNSSISYNPVVTPYLVSGTGTYEDPMYWMIDNSNTLDADFFNSIMPENTDELYIVLISKEHNANNGRLQQAFGWPC
jgi:hypothetical protein